MNLLFGFTKVIGIILLVSVCIPCLFNVPSILAGVGEGPYKKHYYYLIGMSLAFDGILPVLQYLLWNGTVALNGDINVSSITGMVTLYPCIGYFLEHKLNLQNCSKKISCSLGSQFFMYRYVVLYDILQKYRHWRYL